ncbi:MAG: hypothetical protein V3T79_01025 [Candidatus Scalindua sediminis]
MKKYFIYLIPFMVLILISSAEAWEVKSGDLFHITGCENGELFVPIVNMWSKPGGLVAGAKVVGKLSGNGREDARPYRESFANTLSKTLESTVIIIPHL